MGSATVIAAQGKQIRGCTASSSNRNLFIRLLVVVHWSPSSVDLSLSLSLTLSLCAWSRLLKSDHTTFVRFLAKCLNICSRDPFTALLGAAINHHLSDERPTSLSYRQIKSTREFFSLNSAIISTEQDVHVLLTAVLRHFVLCCQKGKWIKNQMWSLVGEDFGRLKAEESRGQIMRST